MSSWLIAFVGCIYLSIGVMQFIKGQIGMGITFTGYAFSNIGLYLLAK
jgi:TM2 domain-containing membrane protein YozV